MSEYTLSQINAKLDTVLALLRQLVPNPGYHQGPDGVWRNVHTGEAQYEEMARKARGLNHTP